MPRRSFRRRFSVSKPRRKLIWARNAFEAQVNFDAPPALAAPTRVDILNRVEASIGASLVGATVMRTRGLLLPIAQDATENAVVRATMYVGDNNDVDRGPNANDNSYDGLSENRDFFFFEPFIVLNGTFPQADGNPGAGRLIDVKSRRKVEEVNQTVIFDLSASGLGLAAGAVTFWADFSTLIALP